MESRNALGVLIKTLPKETRSKVFEIAVSVRENYSRKNFRQYFYRNKSNPARIDKKVQEQLVRIEPRFKFVFVPNYQADKVIKELSLRLN